MHFESCSRGRAFAHPMHPRSYAANIKNCYGKYNFFWCRKWFFFFFVREILLFLKFFKWFLIYLFLFLISLLKNTISACILPIKRSNWQVLLSLRFFIGMIFFISMISIIAKKAASCAKRWPNVIWIFSQLAFSYSKSNIETPEQFMESVFNINNKYTRTRSATLFWYFYCWMWTNTWLD